MPSMQKSHRSKAAIVAGRFIYDTFSSGVLRCRHAFRVFEHLPDRLKLGKIRRLLKPGGIILIEVPNIDTRAVQLLRQYHRHFVQDHLYFFSPKTLQLLVVKHDFYPLLTYRPKRYITHTIFLNVGERVC